MECSWTVYLPIVKWSDEVASFEGVFGLVDVLLGSADFALSRCLTNSQAYFKKPSSVSIILTWGKPSLLKNRK